MFNHKNYPNEQDPLKARFKGMKGKLRASTELKAALKTGVPLRTGKREGTAVHVRRFGKAIVAYAAIVMLVIGVTVLIPWMMARNEPTTNAVGSGVPTAAPELTTSATQSPPVTSGTQTGRVCDCELNHNDLPYVYHAENTHFRSLESLLEGLDELHNAIDRDSIHSEGLRMWHDDTNLDGGGLGTWFDGSPVGGVIANSEEICGGGVLTSVPARVFFHFQQQQSVIVEAYVISVGESDHDATGKEPIEWALRATNDPTLPVEEWVVLDYVYEGCVLQYEADDSDETPPYISSGYAIDKSKQGSYQYYCWELGYTTDNAVDITEFALYGRVE